MSAFAFDATITIVHHHLRMAAAGVGSGRGSRRKAVQGLLGARWIDIEVAEFPPSCRDSVLNA